MHYEIRESEILETLDSLSKSRVRFVVVGGYAVSALASHRFSMDCDYVLAERDLERTEASLLSLGFLKEQEVSGLDDTYGAKFVRYVKKMENFPVRMDLMVNALVSRETEGSWGFDYIIPTLWCPASMEASAL